MDIHDELLKNVKENNILKVKQLIENDIHNNIDIDQASPLIISAEKGFYDMTKLLLDSGANINVDNSAALLYACVCERSHIVKLLLDEGINTGNKHFQKELFFESLYNDDVETMMILMEHGLDADINYIFKGCIALHKQNILQFITNNYPEVIENITVDLYNQQKKINIYRFIKMLIDREIIDIAD